MGTTRSWFIYLFLIICTLGCEYLPFNRGPLDGPFRYKMVEKISKSGRVIFEDLEGNNQYTYFRYQVDLDGGFTIITLNNEDNTNDQNNFDGEIRAMEFLDWNEDGKKDILVVNEVNDSCYATIYDKEGNTLIERFLFAGKPRFERKKRHEWLGRINQIRITDLENDGKKELVAFLSETTGGKPRGVFSYDLKTLELNWKYEIGPPLISFDIIDVDNNGTLEILMATSAPDNGNTANNTADTLSYVILVSHEGKEIWKKQYGEIFSATYAAASDIDNDGSINILVAKARGETEKNPDIRLEYVNPLNGEPLESIKFPFYSDIHFAFLQIDQSLDKEILISDISGNIQLLDHQFNPIIQKKFPEGIGDSKITRDLTGDGLDEFALDIQGRWFIINHKLQIIAEIDGNLQIIPNYPNYAQYSYLQPRRNSTPLLVNYNENDQMTRFMSLERNPYFILQLIGPWVIIVLSFSLVVFIILWTVRTTNRLIILKRSFTVGLALNNKPCIFINRKMQIEKANSAAIQLLSIKNNPLPMPVSSIPDTVGNLKRHLLNLKSKGFIRQEETILATEASTSKLSFIAEPIGQRGRRYPHWLVVFNQNSLLDSKDAVNWAKMAQRLAHDIKNPLTSILLTQQRLQKEYRNEDTDKIERYDKYSNRIVERIEDLRKLSRNFMKYVNVEKINSQPTNINHFLEKIFSNSTIDLPKDIQLQKNLGVDLPVIHVDQELIHSVIENLVSNAVNAMPNGGTLTISTNFVAQLQPGGSEQPPNDYLVIEVSDIGIGIPDDMKDQLFKPFVTSTKQGTGLGLTIVRKIIDDHKGHIEVNSEKGVGTTFTIYLPLNIFRN